MLSKLSLNTTAGLFFSKTTGTTKDNLFLGFIREIRFNSLF